MVKLDRIYTRGGDGGETSLGDGARVSKDDKRVEAIGDVDELNAVLGLARVLADPTLDRRLAQIQNDIFDLGADLCTAAQGGGKLAVTGAQVARLERWIDADNADLAPLKSFVLPAGAPAAAWLHLARTTCRRAERRVVALARVGAVNPEATRYLNRLSDLLFVCARAANGPLGDTLWTPGGGDDA